MSERRTALPHGMSAFPDSACAPACPARKSFWAGTHRVIPPAETVARLRRFMPVMGITRIANVTGLDRIGVPVVMVCRPNARSLAVAQGKGLDLDSARASGLMESIETYHAEHITLPLKLCSLEELRYTHHVVDVSRLPCSTHGLFDPNQRLLWIEGHDLLRNRPAWLPYDVVHADYTVTHRYEGGAFIASTNGLASGNHLLEAISHGICEVVERDASTLWSLRDAADRRSTRIDLQTVHDSGCCEILHKCDRAGIAVAVWEITSDVGIPAFRCTLTERNGHRIGRLYPAHGMGCHPDAAIALLRALTEACQSRLTAISGSRDDVTRQEYEALVHPNTGRDHLAPLLDDPPTRPFPDLTWSGDTFDQDVEWELERLRAAGVEEVVAVDLSRPEFGIPVVRVVIPGLEFLNDHGPYRYGRRAHRAMESSR